MLAPQRASRDSPLSLFPVTGFGGLNLVDDPQEVGFSGAIDVLNVDFDDRSRIRARDGIVKVTTVAASENYRRLFPFVGTAARYLVGVRQSGMDVIDSTGAVAYTGGSVNVNTAVMCGTPSTLRLYYTNLGVGVGYFDGATFTNAPTATVDGVAGRAMPQVLWLAVQQPDNRLVAAGSEYGRNGGPNGTASSPSHVHFSQPNDPLTWLSNDYVQLAQGDGEQIQGAVSWRGLLFVFKETKYFIFYGNNTDAQGDTSFNYRTVDTGIGASPAYTSTASSPVVAGSDGVYFMGRNGRVYRTTGGNPTLVSDPLAPLAEYRAGPSSWQGGSLGLRGGMTLWGDRIVIPGATAGSLFVFNPNGGTWTYWQSPLFGASTLGFNFDAGKPDLLYFPYASTATKNIGRIESTATDDVGAAITSRYRTGFSDLGIPESEKLLREVIVDTTGTVTVKIAVNDGTLDSGKVVAGGRVRRGYRGRNFSVELSGTGAWEASRLACATWDQRPAQERST